MRRADAPPLPGERASVEADGRAAGPAPRQGCVGRGLTSPEPPDDASAAPPRSCGPVALSRNVTFRTALTFWLLFMACFGASGLFFYQTLQQRVLERIDLSISDRQVELESVHRSEGVDAMIRVARRRDERPMREGVRIGLHLSDGTTRVAGNVPVFPAGLGWTVVRGTELGLPDDDCYRFLTTLVGGHELSLGRSLYPLEELRAVALHCLLWALAGSTLLAIAAAAWLARRVQRRLDTLRGAIGRVASGDLDARLPISGRRDDIDVMSGTINDALERLSRSVEGMRQVSTDIAHDLKTPLNRLWIRIEEAAARSRDGHCVGDELDAALEEARGVDATFEALLRIAQIEAGARRARFAPFDIGAVLDNVAEIYEPVLEEQGQTLALEREPGASLPLLGDRELVTQLVVNLVENASHHGGSGVAVHLAAGTTAGRSWLAVTDDGPGVPAAERTRVLQRLYRLERSRTTRGTGLGLSLVKAIVELHGGELLLEDNEPGLKVTARFASSDVAPAPAR